MSLQEKREKILQELESMSNKELLSSLPNGHVPCNQAQFLDQDIHSTGTPSVSDRTISANLAEAFQEADNLFAQLNS